MKKIFLISLILPFFIQTDVQASAFYNRLYTDVNRAFAGDVAAGRDPSTVYANPAGMVLLEKPEAKGGGGFIFNHTRFKNSNSIPPEGNFLISTTSARPITPNFIPNLYAVYPFEHLALGLGITSLYHIDTEYDVAWIGRFDTVRTKLETVEIAPSVAFEITDRLTFGLGVDFQYAYAEFSKAKTISNEFLAAVGSPNIAELIASGVTIPEFRTKFKGKDWSLGVNTGLIIKANENLKLGLNFHSATTCSLEGHNTTAPVPTGSIDTDQVTVAIAALETLPAIGELKLPNIVTFGGSWDINDQWNIGAQVQWFNWSRFEEIKIISKEAGSRLGIPFGGPTTSLGFNPGDTLNIFLPKQFDDTFSASVGTTYKVLDNLSFQFGFLYDQTPTKNPFRSPSIPDGDAYWLTTGLTYEVIPGVSGNLGYAHIFMNDTPAHVISNAAILLGTNNTTINGSFNSSIDILSASLGIRF